jgi:hypothetical protein
MKDLKETQQKLLELKGETIGIECIVKALLRAMPLDQLAATLREFDAATEAAKVALLNHAQTSDRVLDGLDACARRVSASFLTPGLPEPIAAWWRHPAA